MPPRAVTPGTPPGPSGQFEPAGVALAVDRLVDEWRAQALWYLRPGYYPVTDAERIAVLEALQERCNLADFRRAGVLKQWLSRRSSDAFASSPPSWRRAGCSSTPVPSAAPSRNSAASRDLVRPYRRSRIFSAVRA